MQRESITQMHEWMFIADTLFIQLRVDTGSYNFGEMLNDYLVLNIVSQFKGPVLQDREVIVVETFGNWLHFIHLRSMVIEFLTSAYFSPMYVVE